MAGMQVSRILYNFDTAKRFKTVILVEGAFDAIRVGPPAVAVLGRSISTHNVDKLVSLVSRTGATIVVALDPDISKTDKQSRHHIEVAVNKIKHHYSKVMPLYLTSGSDPASLTRQEFRRLLYESAAAQNVTLDFSLTKER
jgi:DNA primase